MSGELNKDFIQLHLREAAGEIAELLEEIKHDQKWEIGRYTVAMRHLYHYINSAWNARYATKKEADVCSEEDFDRWRQYPNDLEIL